MKRKDVWWHFWQFMLFPVCLFVVCFFEIFVVVGFVFVRRFYLILLFSCSCCFVVFARFVSLTFELSGCSQLPASVHEVLAFSFKLWIYMFPWWTYLFDAVLILVSIVSSSTFSVHLYLIYFVIVVGIFGVLFKFACFINLFRSILVFISILSLGFGGRFLCWIAWELWHLW